MRISKSLIVLGLLAVLLLNPPTYAQTATQFAVALQVFFGLADYSHTTLVNYNEPSTSTAVSANQVMVSIPASGTLSLTLANLFPGAGAIQFIALQDASNPGIPLKFAPSSSSAYIYMNPNGFVAFRTSPTNTSASGLGSFSIINTSSTQIAYVVVSILSN